MQEKDIQLASGSISRYGGYQLDGKWQFTCPYVARRSLCSPNHGSEHEGPLCVLDHWLPPYQGSQRQMMPATFSRTALYQL